jgi:hypothetical protein
LFLPLQAAANIVPPNVGGVYEPFGHLQILLRQEEALVKDKEAIARQLIEEEDAAKRGGDKKKKKKKKKGQLQVR